MFSHIHCDDEENENYWKTSSQVLLLSFLFKIPVLLLAADRHLKLTPRKPGSEKECHKLRRSFKQVVFRDKQQPYHRLKNLLLKHSIASGPALAGTQDSINSLFVKLDVYIHFSLGLLVVFLINYLGNCLIFFFTYCMKLIFKMLKNKALGGA